MNCILFFFIIFSNLIIIMEIFKYFNIYIIYCNIILLKSITYILYYYNLVIQWVLQGSFNSNLMRNMNWIIDILLVRLLQ